MLDNRSKSLQQKRRIFSHHCDRIPNESSLGKEGLIVAFSLRGVFGCVGEGTVETTGDS